MRRKVDGWAVLAAVALLAAMACGSPADVACEAEAPYVACGCGCCSGVEPTPQCLAAGESVCDVIERDRAQAAAPECATAGCVAGIEYRVCSR